MEKPRVSLALVAALMLALAARADIAPTQFIGSGIASRSVSTIRMEKAAVEIDWGTPCRLTATFRMVNASATPQEIRVGFPMPGSHSFISLPTKAPDDLVMTFNGEHAVVTPPRTDDDRDVGQAWVWYHTTHTFKPGTTIVVVKTPLYASLVPARPYRESLFYCIQTGGNWHGTIGEEEVIIRFPHAVATDQITAASPAGYEVEGNCVRWRFVDIKPIGKEHDISLSYVRPDAMHVLAGLRQELAQRPESSATAVKLAKHLLALGNTKSNAGYPPSQLGREQYDALLKNIPNAADRKTFMDYYRATAEGLYKAPNTEWTQQRTDLVPILADAGYRDPHSLAPHLLEGERLLKDTLAREPQNADAWNIYLANYWRFAFAAVGSWSDWVGMNRLRPAQAQLIEIAARNCPDDECIRSWLELRRSPSDRRDLTGLHEAMKRRGVWDLDFPKLDYGYY